MTGAFNTKEAIASAKQRISYLREIAQKQRKAAEDYCERERKSRGHGGCVIYPSNMFGKDANEDIQKLEAAVAFMEKTNSDTLYFSDKEVSLIFGIPNT